MTELIILGGGPAGVSAALYAARAALAVTLVENGPKALAKAKSIENYYGLKADGPEMYAAGLAQASSLGVKIIHGEALDAEDTGSGFKLLVKTADGKEPQELAAPMLLLATGAANLSLNVPGLTRLEGRGVSYCAVCDGFFFRGRTVGVAGSGLFALHEAEYLKHLASEVIIFTDGGDAKMARAANYKVKEQKIRELTGTERLESVILADGESVPLDGLFLALGTADSGAVAKKLGAELNGRFIMTDGAGATSIPGLFAAGDCTGGLQQVATAVGEGALAGMAAVRFARSLRQPGRQEKQEQ